MTTRTNRDDAHDPAQAEAARGPHDSTVTPSWSFWLTLTALSAAGSIAAVRFARPFTLDEVGTTFLLLALLPALAIRLVGALRRPVGILAAFLMPVFWLYVTTKMSDSILLWALPLAAGLAVILTARHAQDRRLPRALPLVAVGLLGLALLWPAPGRPAYGTRAVLFGVDGASWTRIDPLTEQGRMPRFARMIAHGHRARLRSLPVLYSPRVWSTIATGVPTEVHGITDFSFKQNDYRVGRLWDQLKLEGRSIGTCGWYFTWPPLERLGPNDFVVPSLLAPNDQAFPPEYGFFHRMAHATRTGDTSWNQIVDATVSALRNGVRLSSLRMAAQDRFARTLLHRSGLDENWHARHVYCAMQGDIFAELLRTRQPEFATVLLTQVDKVSHLYWKYLYPEGFPEVTAADIERRGMAVDAIYEQIDRNLAKALQVTPPEANFIIVSDHGFRPATKQAAGRHCRIRTERLLETLGMHDTVFGSNVDHIVFLRPMADTASERERMLDRLYAILGQAHIAGEDAPLFAVTRETDALRFTIAPRVALPESARVVLDGAHHPFDALVRARVNAYYSGAHHPDGIYIFSGPSANRAVRTDSLHVLNVAPTVAALLEMPISPLWTEPPAVTGVSLATATVAEYPLPNAPESGSSRIIDESLREKLRSIGYLQ